MSPILNNLLRCPFCGGEAVIKKNKTVMVSCKKCTASAFQRLDDKDSAINNWNSRSHLSLSALGDEDWWELFDAMVPSTYLEGVNAVYALPEAARKHVIFLLTKKAEKAA